MKIILPRYSGFCFGVKMAVDAAKSSPENTYLLGEVVHNPRVLDGLQQSGLIIAGTPEEIPDNSTVLIRAHGEAKKTIEDLQNRNIIVIDKTCPRVSQIHKLVECSTRPVVLAGKKEHPETVGICGHCNTQIYIVENIEDVAELPNLQTCLLVAQTTFSKDLFSEIYEELQKSVEKIEFHNTICNATTDRQNEIEELSKMSDAVVVIGGKKSSNVNRLYEIAKGNCKNVVFIENPEELNPENFENSVLIASGASTPIEDVEKVSDLLTFR